MLSKFMIGLTFILVLSFFVLNSIGFKHNSPFTKIVLYPNPVIYVYRSDNLHLPCGKKMFGDENDRIMKFCKAAAKLFILPFFFCGFSSYGDDELAKYASEGNKVGIDGQCFLRKCALETSSCANNPTCFKGLSCLARSV